jgi:polysaccharide biosynthesis protein PslH
MNRPSTDFASSSGTQKPAALFLAPEAPYPMAGGGPIRAASVLEYLAQRFSVHAIFFREPGAPDPAASVPRGLVDRVDVIELSFHSKGPLPRVVRNLSRMVRGRPPLVDRFSGFQDRIAGCIEGRQYEAACIEHFWCAPYVEQLRPNAKRVLLNLYDVESAWHRSMADSTSGVLGWSYARFGKSALNLERACFPRFDCILTTSASDAERVQGIAAGANVVVYPNALPLIVPPPRAERLEIVFSGNLEYAPNIAAVQFFQRNVWPALQSRWPGLKWKLLGKNAGPFRDLPRRDPSIELTGFVEDAVATIAQSQVAIVPLLAGSGTRVKILEAWAARTPVVSTTLGAEGLEYRNREHLVLADDPESFITAVSELLALPDDRARLGAAGRRLYEERYTWQAAWKALDPVFDRNR